MKEFVARMASRPLIAAELLVASLLVSALALAPPVFVIQVLNRYVAYGIDSTLATLTAGVVIAIIFEFLFRHIRLQFAERLCEKQDAYYQAHALNLLTVTRNDAFQTVPAGHRIEAATGPDAIRAAYSASNLITIVDVPFALVFLLALWLLSPALGAIAAGFCLLVFLIALSSLWTFSRPTAQTQRANAQRSGLLSAAIKAPQTLRLFDNAMFFSSTWRKISDAQAQGQDTLQRRSAFAQALQQGAQGMLSVGTIAVGALLVVSGDLDVGALIGANILAARALAPIAKFGQLARGFAHAKDAQKTLAEFATAPVMRQSGTQIDGLSGALSLSDLGFVHAKAKNPLFEGLSVSVEPGQTLVITGPNGAGKSTLAELICGLFEPGRGQVLVDGVALSQLDPSWWRRQIRYVPQEPHFLPGTIAENLKATNPDIEPATIDKLLDVTDLRGFVDESTDGLNTQITETGSTLAVGIRRRLALARALANKGRIMIVDEPTEGLDNRGRQAMYGAMNAHAQAGGVIVACTQDPDIIKGANWVVDLRQKPKPQVMQMRQAAKSNDHEISATTSEGA